MKVYQTTNAYLSTMKASKKSAIIALWNVDGQPMPMIGDMTKHKQGGLLILPINKQISNVEISYTILQFVKEHLDAEQIIVSCGGGYSSPAIAIALNFILNGDVHSTNAQYNEDLKEAMITMAKFGLLLREEKK